MGVQEDKLSPSKEESLSETHEIHGHMRTELEQEHIYSNERVISKAESNEDASTRDESLMAAIGTTTSAYDINIADFNPNSELDSNEKSFRIVKNPHIAFQSYSETLFLKDQISKLMHKQKDETNEIQTKRHVITKP